MAEDLSFFILPPQGVGLAGELGDGQRQSRGGDGQKQVVDVVGDREMGLALVADDVPQRDLVNGADDLHNGHSGSQNRRAAQERLLFLFGHEENTSNY